MSKRSPFDYVKSINEKGYLYDLSGYVPFLTNRAFSMHIDTIMLAEEMNQAHGLSPLLQYEFYYYAVRRGKRFGFPKKAEEEDLEHIMRYYNYSEQKAKEVKDLLTDEQVSAIKSSFDTGGRV